jgi:hypothetical protein
MIFRPLCVSGPLCEDGELDLALTTFDSAVQRNPTHTEAHYLRGVALAKKGRIPEASAEFQFTLRANPTHPAAQGWLAWCDRSERWRIVVPARRSVTAKVGKKSVKGKLVSHGIPGATPGLGGIIRAELLEEDVAAIRTVAGTYDGSVLFGLPGFEAVTTLGANGTYTVDTIRRPDGSPAPGRIGGVYMLGTPLNGDSFDRRVYALPLSVTRNSGEAEVDSLPGVTLCDCCPTKEARDAATRAMTDGDGQASKSDEPNAGNAKRLSALSLILQGGYPETDNSYTIQGIRRE